MAVAIKNRLKRLGNSTFARFAVIGFSAAVLQLFIYNALLRVTHYEVASTASLAAATVFSYVGNRLWAFQSRRKFVSEFIWYVISRLSMIALNDAVLYVLVSWFSFSKFIAELIAIVVTTFGNFYVGKLLIFRREDG